MMLAIPEQSENSKKEAIERAKISAKLMQDFLESSTEWNNNKTYKENREKQEALALACIFNYDFSKEEYVEKSSKILEENLTKITSFVPSRDEDLQNINSQLSKILLSRDTNKNDNNDETLNSMLENLQNFFISQSKKIANASKVQEILTKVNLFNNADFFDSFGKDYTKKSPKILEENLTKITSFVPLRDSDSQNMNAQLSKILLSRDTNGNDNNNEILEKIFKNLQQSFIKQSRINTNASRALEKNTKINTLNTTGILYDNNIEISEKSQKLLEDNLSKITAHSVDRTENLAKDITNQLRRIAINRILKRFINRSFDSEYTTFDKLLENLKYANSSTMYNPFYWSDLLDTLREFVIKSNAKEIIQRFFKEKSLKTHIDDILPNTLVQLSVLSLLDVGLDYDEKSEAKKNFLLKRKTELEKEIEKNIATYKSILGDSYELSNLTEKQKTERKEWNSNFFAKTAKASKSLISKIKDSDAVSTEESLIDLKRFKTVSFDKKNKVEGTDFEKILASGFDFLPSHYDAYFLWHTVNTATTQFDNIKDKVKLNTITDIEKLFLNSNGLAVRMTSISIPQMKNVSYNVGGVHHDIKKISSSKNISRKSTFTFRLDSGLAWMNLFGQLYGENNFYTVSDDKIKSWNDVTSDRRQYIHTIANCLSSKSSYYFSNDQHLCLYVLEHDDKKRHRLIKFEDIKIVGAGSDITYSSDGGTTDLSVEFIYKRMIINDYRRIEYLMT